jgi:hypothetical protein
MTDDRSTQHPRACGRRRAAAACVALTLALCIPAAARADVVTDWNSTTFTVAGGPFLIRNLAMVHLAMFDAANSIERRYRPYAFQIDVPRSTSADAAAVAAAARMLVLLVPAQLAVVNAHRDAALALVADGPSKSDGIALGVSVAEQLFALRSTDNWTASGPVYVYGSAPGTYQATPPLPNSPPYPQPVNTGAASWAPFTLTSASQFRANGPLPLTHPRYGKDLAEVREVGAAVGSTRTADQTLTAMWHVEASPPALNRIARAAAIDSALELLESARLFALLNIAMADGVLSVFEAKYAYNTWRPVTAIQNADADGNPATAADPSWQPFLATPRHPEYPSAHGVVQGSGVEVLNAIFGRHHAFTTTSTAPGVEGIVRAFESFDAFAADGESARIFGGLHFRAAVEEGSRQGKKLGKWVLEHCLLPIE